MSLRVGGIGYNTSQGLGILLKAFYDHGVITEVLVVCHGRRPGNPGWFPGAKEITSLRGQRHDMEEFCARQQVMFFMETPHLWDLIPYCRERGVKTVLQTMYECTPERLPYQPDYFINPSLLDQQYYPDRSVFIPVPVEVPWRQRTRAETFVHNSGHGGLKGRNGTREVVEAWEHVKSEAKLILRTQDHKTVGQFGPKLCHASDLRVGTFPAETLWDEGDVFLFPEKFNGLSLPLQEARAAGMLVMCGERFPMMRWLPNEPLIPVAGYRKNRIGGCNEFDEAVFDPKTIAATVDRWYGQDISDYSLGGKAWAETMSWAALKPRYMEALHGLADGR